mgnify:FL=1
MKQETLEQLLTKVDKAFGMDKQPATSTFVYSVGPIRGGWQFDVTDNWHAWLDKHYHITFYGRTAKECVRSFLDYIKDNQVKPAKLRHKEKE